jgi:hypothetical protein
MKLITNHSMKTDDDILMKNKVTKIIKIKRIVLLLFFKNQCQVYLHHVRVVPVFKVLEYLMSKFSISTIFLCKTFECQLQKKIMPNKVNQQLTKERKEKNFYPLTLLYFNHIYHYIRTIFFPSKYTKRFDTFSSLNENSRRKPNGHSGRKTFELHFNYLVF